MYINQIRLPLEPPLARAVENRSDRRGAIARALYSCIRRQGYANTSLKEIAAAADMSPSHLGYYFDNKASILEYYAFAICKQNLAELPDPAIINAENFAATLADFCLSEGQTSLGLLGVIQELTGLAVHDPHLLDIKTNHSKAWREYLTDLFQKLPLRAGLTAEDCAYHIHALIVGLNTNLLFDPKLESQRARLLLLQSLNALIVSDEQETEEKTEG